MAAGDLRNAAPRSRFVITNSTSTDYSAGDFVLCGGTVFRCVEDIAAGAVTETELSHRLAS